MLSKGTIECLCSRQKSALSGVSALVAPVRETPSLSGKWTSAVGKGDLASGLRLVGYIGATRPPYLQSFSIGKEA